MAELSDYCDILLRSDRLVDKERVSMTSTIYHLIWLTQNAINLLFFVGSQTVNTCKKWVTLRNEIKSYGKFAIFSELKIEGLGEKANFGKIETRPIDCVLK